MTVYYHQRRKFTTYLSSITSSGLRASPSILSLASWYSFCLCSKVLTGRALASPFCWPLASDDGRFRMRIAGSGITHWGPIHALSSTVTLQPTEDLTGAQSLFSLICCSSWKKQAQMRIASRQFPPASGTLRDKFHDTLTLISSISSQLSHTSTSSCDAMFGHWHDQAVLPGLNSYRRT